MASLLLSRKRDDKKYELKPIDEEEEDQSQPFFDLPPRDNQDDIE